MTFLLDLPGEILLDIASYLDEADLLNTSLTSRQLEQAIKSEVYREYTNTSRFSERSLQMFLKRLITEPKLATYVRRVYLAENHGTEEIGVEEYTLFTETAFKAGVVVEIIPWEEADLSALPKPRSVDSRYTQSDSEDSDYTKSDDHESIPGETQTARFYRLLCARSKKLLVFLLLALLPNIQHLGLFNGDFNKPRSRLSWDVIPHQFSALKSFTALEAQGSDEWSLQAAEFRSIIQGSGIHTLRLFLAWGDLEPDSTWRLANITNLVLEECMFDKEGMGLIMKACGPLKSFFYSKRGEDNFSVPDVVKLLEPHRKSLEDLYLDMYEDWEEGYQTEDLPSLQRFPKLAKIDTTTTTWPGWFHPHDPAHPDFVRGMKYMATLDDRLPPSLQHLVLRTKGDPSFDVRRVLPLISATERGRLNLKHITVIHPDALDEFEELLWDINSSVVDLVLDIFSEDQSALRCPSAWDQFANEVGADPTNFYHSEFGTVCKNGMYTSEKWTPTPL